LTPGGGIEVFLVGDHLIEEPKLDVGALREAIKEEYAEVAARMGALIGLQGHLRQRLLVGPAAACAEKLAAYRAAGANRIFLWPVGDELGQLAAFQEQVAPLVRR
jgi:alkanesulfonate monooxygenase SsuD/methylene tetrahydromethanopterin reductase-like flavin-dependent oxidoreductase (luciferase family)